MPEQIATPVQPVVREPVLATPEQVVNHHHYYNNVAPDVERPARDTVVTSRGGSWILPLLILLLLLVVGLPIGGLFYYHYNLGPSVVTEVDENKSALKLCDDSCQKQIIRVRCGAEHRVFTNRIDITPEQFGVLVDKVCKVVTPVVAPPADPIVQKIYVREPPPKAKPHRKQVVVRRPPPVEDVGYQDNLPDAHCSTCGMYKRLNSEDDTIDGQPVITHRRRVYEAESLPQLSQAPASGVVCVSVLQGEPSALVLRDGPDNHGGAIIGWKPSTIGWQETSRGYIGRVCFSAAIIANRDVVTLCGAENHSTFRRHHIEELLSRREIPASDPACLLGRWECARYGL